MIGHGDHLAVPVCLTRLDGDDARLDVVHVIPHELMHSQGDGSINFVLFHTLYLYRAKGYG